MTQRQLAAVVGYDHSMVSRWESGTREPPPWATVRRLDVALNTGGLLAESLRLRQARRGGPLTQQALFPAMPARWAAAGGRTALPAPGGWPDRLPQKELNCPLHGSARCAVPDITAVHTLFTSGASFPDGEDGDLIHGLTALLECLVVENRTDLDSDATAHVERVLRSVVSWAESVHAAGRLPRSQLILSAHYAVLAGRLRRQNGQSAAAMAWFGHGTRWAEASGDLSARAALLGEMSALARAEHDVDSALSYAQALTALAPDRGWTAALSHIFQARAYARASDLRECRRHLTLARRRLDVLDRRDLEESPCLDGTQGLMHLESTAGAALRDLAVSTGDRRLARQAVRATSSALDYLPQWMQPIRLLLTVRLADSYACAGDPDSAWETASPVLRPAALSPRTVISEELRGLSQRLIRT
ncbi:XRE family transcriptional regulator [Streptomyces armeniacus]|uniref:XRE family transcriptional regulator n=2 Tax=Streptomyces armeniacus TaxID=83291 RepID=A0A345XIH6_9ACTN|nr:XRE family transcriptional regulator [Streptomyces armeniacus]